MLTFKYPYTNFSEVNLDYVLAKMRETVIAVNSLETGMLKDVAISGNTLVFTKGDDSKIYITLPTGVSVNIKCVRSLDDLWLFSDDLAVNGETEFLTDITSAEFNNFKNNVAIGNPAFVHIVSSTDVNYLSFAPYLHNTNLLVDLTGRGDDNSYIQRTFMVSHHYNSSTGNHIKFTRLI